MTETPARRWPKTGTVGAHISKDVGDHCTTGDPAPVIPVRPYPGELGWPPQPLPKPLLNAQDAAILIEAGAAPDSVDVSPPLPNPPPGPAELLAMADDLNSHGGLDEKFVAELIRQAVTDEPLTAAYKALGAPRPVEPRSEVRGEGPPFGGLTDILTPRTLDEVWPPESTADFITRTANRMIGAAPVDYDELVALFARLPRLRQLDTVKLTQAQLDAFPHSRMAAPSSEPWSFFGVPVELVERVEDSTPYQLANAQPGGIVEFRSDLNEAELEQMRADWLRAVDAKPVLSQWLVEEDRKFVAHVNDGVDRAAVLDAVRAAARRPWWRRALARIRRRPR